MKNLKIISFSILVVSILIAGAVFFFQQQSKGKDTSLSPCEHIEDTLARAACEQTQRSIPRGKQEGVQTSSLSLTDSVKLCDEFRDSVVATPCEEALSRALEDTPGIIQSVSIGFSRVPNLSNPTEFKQVKMWLVVLKPLASFKDESGKRNGLLQIGIPTDSSNKDIYRHTL